MTSGNIRTLAFLFPVLSLALHYMSCQDFAQAQADQISFKRKTNQSVPLIPDSFSLPIRLAYLAAQKYPDKLSKVFCYCGCDQAGEHASLLDCFRSDHGTDCKLCQEEAIVTQQFADRGASMKEIHARIEADFARSYPFKKPSPALERYRVILRKEGLASLLHNHNPDKTVHNGISKVTPDCCEAK